LGVKPPGTHTRSCRFCDCATWPHGAETRHRKAEGPGQPGKPG
jgi:hypothetical protein